MAKEKTFEEKMKELETIISALENGEFGLEESINQYTKAMELVHDCDQELKNVEERISKVVNNETEEDFKIEE
jgi:exodeoxyribonuclease VII small subunit